MAAPTMFIVSYFARKVFVPLFCNIAEKGAGAMLLPGGTGGEQPPASFSRLCRFPYPESCGTGFRTGHGRCRSVPAKLRGCPVPGFRRP